MKTELLCPPSDLVVAFGANGLDRLDFVHTAIGLIDALLERVRLTTVYVNWYAEYTDTHFRITGAGYRQFKAHAYLTVNKERPAGYYPTVKLHGTHYFLYPTVEESAYAIRYVSSMIPRVDFIKLVGECCIKTTDRDRINDEVYPWLHNISRRTVKLQDIKWDNVKLNELKDKLNTELTKLLPY